MRKIVIYSVIIVKNWNLFQNEPQKFIPKLSYKIIMKVENLMLRCAHVVKYHLNFHNIQEFNETKPRKL